MKLALFLWATLAANAADPSVHGRITDVAGRPVAGAVVSLKSVSFGNAGAGKTLLSLSSADGSYSFSPLVTGVDYELHADHEGLASTVRTLRVSNPDEIVTINLAVGPRIRFEDIAAKAGLDFTLRNGATGHFSQPEIMLGGVAAFDYNNDGCMDIFVTNGTESNRLYRNNCDMTFTDVTVKAGLVSTGYSMGVGAADYDNDGFVDLLVTGLTETTLYRNRGDGTFENVTAHAGLKTGDKRWSISAGWFDYDNDGYLDLFVTNYVRWTPETEVACRLNGAPYYCHPGDYRGLPNQLFHNNHDGTFTDVSLSSGIGASVGKGMGLAFGDFNGDGLTDVFVANDSIPNFLFQNLGHGKFKEVAVEAGVAYAASGNAVAGMGADFRDINNDGLDDIAIDAMYFDTFPLYRNRGKPDFFTDDTASSSVAVATRNLTGWSMGICDFDNDGNKDLFYATSHFPGSDPFVHSPAETPNHVLRSLGNGSFEDVSGFAGPDFQKPALYHGAAFADFDNDGRVDVVVTAVNGALKLFRNVSPSPGHWIALRLTGTRSNRDGLGTRIRLTLPTGNAEYNRAGTSVGYASSSEPLVRFGLGPYEYAQEIEIRWPDGTIQLLKNIKADQVLKVEER